MYKIRVSYHKLPTGSRFGKLRVIEADPGQTTEILKKYKDNHVVYSNIKDTILYTLQKHCTEEVNEIIGGAKEKIKNIRAEVAAFGDLLPEDEEIII